MTPDKQGGMDLEQAREIVDTEENQGVISSIPILMMTKEEVYYYAKGLVEGHKQGRDSREEELAVKDSLISKLKSEVREWLCVKCRRVYPGRVAEGTLCVVCSDCGGDCGPRRTMELREEREKVKALVEAAHEAIMYLCGQSKLGNASLVALLDSVTRPFPVTEAKGENEVRGEAS